MISYLFYLFFVGPIVAALWVWLIIQFREALPNWVEGVCTLCFLEPFWNTTILIKEWLALEALMRTETIVMSALNFLATSSVKYAFDFAGLVIKQPAPKRPRKLPRVVAVVVVAVAAAVAPKAQRRAGKSGQPAGHGGPTGHAPTGHASPTGSPGSVPHIFPNAPGAPRPSSPRSNRARTWRSRRPSQPSTGNSIGAFSLERERRI